MIDKNLKDKISKACKYRKDFSEAVEYMEKGYIENLRLYLEKLIDENRIKDVSSKTIRKANEEAYSLFMGRYNKYLDKNRIKNGGTYL